MGLGEMIRRNNKPGPRTRSGHRESVYLTSLEYGRNVHKRTICRTPRRRLFCNTITSKAPASVKREIKRGSGTVGKSPEYEMTNGSAIQDNRL
jgi:hypothetical protein